MARIFLLFISFAGATALSIESYLSLHHKSLCHTKACEIVSHYLTIKEPLLIAGGALFLWIFAATLFFAGRYPNRLKNIPYYLLALALSIDSSLMGFQYFIIEQKCALCIAFASLLLLLCLLYCISRKNFILLTCFILLWAGGFSAHKIMTMPTPTGVFSTMAFYKKTFQSVPVNGYQRQMTLILSMNCPHCLKVIKLLAEHKPTDVTFRLASVDTDKESLEKLSYFLKNAPQSANPFKLLVNIKEDKKKYDEPIPIGLKKHNKNSLSYLANVGISGIPVLITETSPQKKIILTGDTTVIAFLKDTFKN